MTIRERIDRWRHDFGYGVHSPLGFRIVREVLNPSRGYAFYGYDRLEALASSQKDPNSERRARMLLRLGAQTQPSIVWHSEELPKIYREALKLAGGIVRILDGSIFPDDIPKAEMIIFYRSIPEEIGKLVGRPDKTIVALDIGEERVREIASMVREGIAFDAVDSALIITGSGISPIVYPVSKSKI